MYAQDAGSQFSLLGRLHAGPNPAAPYRFAVEPARATQVRLSHAHTHHYSNGATVVTDTGNDNYAHKSLPLFVSRTTLDRR